MSLWPFTAAMKNNEKTVTVRWLAKQAGVSVATVSRTLRKPETVAAPRLSRPSAPASSA
jgi:hypothetical protein